MDALSNDPHFSLLIKKDYEEFWELHSENKPEENDFYSADFKDLVVKMLEPKPNSRITLADVRTHAWFKGKMPS
jgi:serine/threonine protein kinase